MNMADVHIINQWNSNLQANGGWFWFYSHFFSLIITYSGFPVLIRTLLWRDLLVFPGGSVGKESACNTGDPDSIPGSGRSSERENGNPLQYSCLENSTDRGAWWATVCEVAVRHHWVTFVFTFLWKEGDTVKISSTVWHCLLRVESSF